MCNIVFAVFIASNTAAADRDWRRPPERLVSTGPYAYTRNPMYLGHLIFLTGLSLALESWLAALITLAVACWFHSRVIGDETKLIQRLGEPYVKYLARVKRWIPGLF